MTPRRKLYEDLQMVVAGHRTDDGLHALTDSLGSMIGFAADSVEQADRIIESLVPDLKKLVRENWDYIRAESAAASAAPRSSAQQ